MVEIVQKKLVQIIGAHLAPHGSRRRRNNRVGGVGFGLRRIALRQLREHIVAGIARRLDNEVVLTTLDDLRQREVEAGGRFGAGVHRGAKAGAACRRAVDRHDERALAPRPVVRVDIWPAKEYAVLYGDRVQVARTYADECETLVGVGLRRKAKVLAVALHVHQP